MQPTVGRTSRDFVESPSELSRSLELPSRELLGLASGLLWAAIALGGLVWFVLSLVRGEPGSTPRMVGGATAPFLVVLFVYECIRCMGLAGRVTEAFHTQENALYGMQLVASDEPLALHEAVPRLKRLSRGTSRYKAQIAREILGNIETATLERGDLPTPHTPSNGQPDDLPRVA